VWRKRGDGGRGRRERRNSGRESWDGEEGGWEVVEKYGGKKGEDKDGGDGGRGEWEVLRRREGELGR
jgi:hypothetical protein